VFFRDVDVVKDRHVSVLSGGELQRLSIAITLAHDVDCYIFDEPSSFLDLKQRLQLASIFQVNLHSLATGV
jgi:ATP-binding cassette subfamily E protein 1